jgi:hypothetical protein
MKKRGKFIHLNLDEFADWVRATRFYRQIRAVQNHHTYIPGYAHFKGDNHFALCEAMENAHLERGFAQIAQNLTSFPDGTLMLCRDFNSIPAGIKGANANGLCIEHLGNFDRGGDAMTAAQQDSIVAVNALLLQRFGLPCTSDHVIYHHWWDLNSGERKDGGGVTKSCPGSAFFGGNSVQHARDHFLPLIAARMGAAATGRPAPQPLFKGVIAASSLRVRDSAGNAGRVIASLAQGAEVAVHEEKDGWYRVHPSASHWVSGRYVERC